MDSAGAAEKGRDQRLRDLTAAMASGSDHAFTQFYERYFDRLFRHLLVATKGDESLARELVQQVLLRVVRYMKPFENEATLWAWLKQVSRSCHIDWLRRNAKLRFTFSMDSYAEPSIEPSVDPNDSLAEALESCLNELAPAEREVITAAYFEDSSRKEIAAEWNSTPKAIESRLARIRQKLRRMILEKLKFYALL
jgi:RNA polymerase sigma factor (sigma-70 family)